MMKVMVCHFVNDSHEVLIAFVVVLPLIVVVEISLQFHRSLSLFILHLLWYILRFLCVFPKYH
jgi:hypothetical protein